MESSQFNVQDYIDILLRRWRLILIPFIITASIVIVISLMIPKTYRSSTLILVERQQIPTEYIRQTVGVGIGEQLETITQQIKSRNILERVINTLNVYGSSKAPMDVKIEWIRKNIFLEVRGKNGFILSFKGDNPEMVMKVANMLSAIFIEESLKRREQQVTGTSEFLESELKLITARLEAKENTLKNYKRKYIGELPEQREANLASLSRFQLEFQTSTDALKSGEDRLVLLQKQAEERKKQMESEVDVNPLQRKLDALRAELSDLQTKYTDKYPDIPRLKREIKETEDKIKREMGSKREGSTARLNIDPPYQTLLTQIKNTEFEIVTLKERQQGIMERIKLYQQRVENTPTREQELITLNRDYESLQANYKSMLNRKLEAQLSENLEKRQKGEKFRIIDPANIPQVPDWPKKEMILLMALGAGAGISFGLVFLLEFIKLGFKKPQELEKAIGLPVFAAIPDFFMFKMKK